MAIKYTASYYTGPHSTQGFITKGYTVHRARLNQVIQYTGL